MNSNQLSALIHTIAHGGGCGANRNTQINDLEKFQVRFEMAVACYYYPRSNKTFVGAHRHSKDDNASIRHKFPPSCVPWVLLYEVIVSFRTTSGCSYFMKDYIAELFGFNMTPTNLAIRHFWAGLTNFIFPKGGSEIMTISADDKVARMSHHSSRTHNATHASIIVNGEDQNSKYIMMQLEKDLNAWKDKLSINQPSQ